VADTPPTLPPDAETRRSRRRALTKSFLQRATENLWLKAASVALALLLWFIITQKEPTGMLVPVRLDLRLDSSLALRRDPTEIYALVQGTPAELARVEGRSATISRSINANTPDTIVITLNRNDVVLPPNLGNARVTDIRPKAVRLEFVPTLTRRVPVRSEIRIIGGDSANLPRVRIDPERVEITGPRLSVSQIEFVRTDTSLILANDSLPHQVMLDTAQLGVTVRPSQVRVRLFGKPRR
jgi:hypothetical protein